MDTQTSTQEAAQADIKRYAEEQFFVTTTAGARVPVPRLNWKKELVLINLIQAVLKDLGPAISSGNNSLMAIVTTVLEIAPAKATKFVSTVMDQSDQWVEENLDISEVIAVILPLLKSRLDLIQAKLAPYLADLAAQNQK
jgi:ABC-type proline/glycine betaine transport system substrate-binding protein